MLFILKIIQLEILELIFQKLGGKLKRNFTVFRICKLINEISEEFREQQSKYLLKRKSKKYIIDKY